MKSYVAIIIMILGGGGFYATHSTRAPPAPTPPPTPTPPPPGARPIFLPLFTRNPVTPPPSWPYSACNSPTRIP